MDRPKRSNYRVDYRRYHLSGDLDKTLQGKVGAAIDQFEEANITNTCEMSQAVIPEDATTAQLQEILGKNREASSLMESQLEQLRIRNEIEAEALKAQQWEKAMICLKTAREKMAEAHEKQLAEIQKMSEESIADANSVASGWLKKHLEDLNKNPTSYTTSEDEKRKLEEERKQEEEKAKKVEQLEQQQAEIQKKLAELKGTPTPPSTGDRGPTSNILSDLLAGAQPTNSQELLMQQLRTALTGKKEEDPNKALLKALVNAQNRTGDPSGVNTLKPELMGKLLSDNHTSMEEWLAGLNRQEEGEFEISHTKCEQEGECKHGKVKSGMLDRATSSVAHKQIWPQKNLGEDWAEDEVDYKHIKFEHLVAGETRTIEMCTEPAQILGRLKLLRRIAYLKLRGFEWHLLRRMYAAILSSIETREYAWDSNFDRFETILYRRVMGDNSNPHNRNTMESRGDTQGRKRFCRDYNKPEGCQKSSPHVVWMGSGQGATKRMVHHVCAACLIKDKQAREHPEGHPDCPHKD